MAALGWLLNLDFAGGAAPPDVNIYRTVMVKTPYTLTHKVRNVPHRNFNVGTPRRVTFVCKRR